MAKIFLHIRGDSPPLGNTLFRFREFGKAPSTRNMSVDLENENLELKLQLAASRAEGEKYRSQLETASKNLDHMVRVEADLNDQLSMVTKVIGDNKAEIDDLTFRIGSADVEINLYREELQDLRNKLLNSEKRAKSLREQLEDLKSGAFISRSQVENSINFRLSKSSAQEDDADFGVGHDLIHDHDHQETVTKIKSLEKLVEELHSSLHQAEEENGTLRSLVNKKCFNSKEQNLSEVVDSVMSIKAEMAVQLKSKDEEIANLKKEQDTALYNLKATKDEELYSLRNSLEEKIFQLQKSLEETEIGKNELQQHCDMLHAKQEYLSNKVPSTFVNSSTMETFKNGTNSIVTTNHNSNFEIIESQSSLEMALKMYVKEGKNDDILQELNKLVLKFEKQKLRNTTLLNKLQNARGNIQVCCRTRPPNSDELTGGGKVIVDGHDENELACYDWKVESWKPFNFDHVWPPEASQADVFSDIEPLIASVAEGYNVCIFAYGQTGSGKTYTMEGYGTDYGIYYRSIQKLFKLVNAKSFVASGFVGVSTTAPASLSRNVKRTVSSHLPSSAHASTTQRRHSMSGLQQTNNLSSLEKVFGSVGSSNRNSNSSATGDNSSNSKASSFRSDSSDISVILANEHQLSDTENSCPRTATAVSTTNTSTASTTGGNKTLAKLPSLFEFSNPISRRRSSLHVSASSEVKKEPLVDEYNFLNERDDSHPLMKVKIEMSMLEIYNEQVYDLLMDRWISSSNSNNNAFSSGSGSNNNSNNNGSNNGSMALDLRQGTDGQVVVHGLSTIEVKDMHEAMAVFAKGASNRATASTQLNAHSSRSHLIVQIDVITEGADDTAGIHSKLFLVDLAGSERIEKSGATGSVLKEAQYINKSLLALGDVMEALDKKQSHIPYRNSKLTHLLQNALGGNARCMMIANVCPTDLTYDETLFTLQFATRVRNINLGVAHRNSNVKNLEEALKMTRAENRELKRKKQALEEALNIAKKEGNSGKFGEKFSEAKIRQMEETKKVAETLIQQLQKQLHDANSKVLEERRLREQAAIDAELLQRNLKKAMEQLKNEQEKSRRAVAGTSLSTATSSAAVNKSNSVRHTAAHTTMLAHTINTTSQIKTVVSSVPTAVSVSAVSRPANHNHTTTASADVASTLPITSDSAFSKRSGEVSPATATITATTATKYGATAGSSSSKTKTNIATCTVATSAALSTKLPGSQPKTPNNKVSDNSSVNTNVTKSSEATPATASAVAKGNTAVVLSPLSSPSSEAKRSSNTSPYKAAFVAMMQKQQQQQQQPFSQPSSNKKTAENSSNKTTPVSARAKSLLEQSMDESSDEEIFEVFIPDAIAAEKTQVSLTDDKTASNIDSNEQGRSRRGLGERKVSLDMILDDLSVASVDEESLTELSLSTGTGSHASHATSTLARRIARNNPGLFHPGMMDDHFLTSNVTTLAKQSPLSASKRPRNSRATFTHSPAGQPRHRQSLVSPSSNTTSPRRVVTSAGSSRLSHSPAGSRGSVTPSTNHTPVSRGSSAHASPAAVSTASARAAMVTTSSPAYRKPLPTSSSPSRNNNNNNQIKTPIVVSTRTPFNLSGNTPSSAAQLRQVIHSVSSPATAVNTSAGTTSLKRTLLKTPPSYSVSHTPGSTGSRHHNGDLNSRVSTGTPKTPPVTFSSHPTIPHSVSSANKTPPSISERAKAALDIHKNRMASREAEKTEVTRSMKFLDKRTRK